MYLSIELSVWSAASACGRAVSLTTGPPSLVSLRRTASATRSGWTAKGGAGTTWTATPKSTTSAVRGRTKGYCSNIASTMGLRLNQSSELSLVLFGRLKGNNNFLARKEQRCDRQQADYTLWYYLTFREQHSKQALYVRNLARETL